MEGRIDPPQLLDADAVFLRLAGEAEIRDQLLGERAPRPLGDERVLRLERHAALAVTTWACFAGFALLAPWTLVYWEQTRLTDTTGCPDCYDGFQWEVDTSGGALTSGCRTGLTTSPPTPRRCAAFSS